MWEKLKRFFGFAEQQPATDAAALEAALRQQAALAQMAAANDENYSLTGDVSEFLRTQLQKQQVTKYGPNGSSRPARFPLQDISLTSMDGYNHRYTGHLISLDGDDDKDKRPHGDRVTLEVTLSGPLEDYDVPQLKTAVRNVIGAIPAFAGKIVAKPMEQKHATYAEVEAGLLPILEKGAFTPEEKATLKRFFEATPNKEDAAPFSRLDSSISASDPREGKFFISIGRYNGIDDSDKKTEVVESADQKVVLYFKEHRKQLVDKIKDKVRGLKKSDGSDLFDKAELESLEKLDLHATTNWGIELMFGTRPESFVEATTGKKLTGEDRAKKFTETPLVKVDKNLLTKLFTESLIEVSNPLPPMLDKFADGHMLAQILRKRMPNNPELEAFIAKHDMFLTRDEKKAREPKAKSADQIELDEPHINGRGSHIEAGKTIGPRISLSFDLPAGMTLHQLYTHIASSKHQMGIAAQQQVAAAANDEQMAQPGGRAA